ncbi:MAG: insulinase family protein [Alphaproteobacteria bacterium]|nr:insulinase family protein [Alphaproteobacteria bacterium]
MKVLIAFTILFLTLNGNAFARNKILDIQEVKSPNGISAWLVEDHSVPVIALKFSFKGAGSSLDPANKQGLARMVSNTMDEGAGNLSSQEFQKELRDLVISLNFGSNRDNFSGNLKTLSKNKTRAFELLELSLTQPRFDKEPVDRMRKANQSRIRSSLSDPNWIAARFLNDIAFAGHPYAQNSGGTLSSLENISPEDLKLFHRSYLGKNNLSVAVAGDITAKDLETVLDKIFGKLAEISIPPTSNLKLQNQGKSFIYKYDIPQTIIEIMQPGIDRKDPDYQIAQVMNFILGSSGFGSRLTETIREKRGLTYGIYTYFYNMEYLDTLALSTSTKNENTAEMLSLIKTEWDKIKSEPVTDKELKNAKAYLIGSLPLSLTSTDKIAGLLLSLQQDDLPIDYLMQRETKIRATTKEEIQELAKSLLNEDQFTTILIGQPEGINNAKLLEIIPNVE